MFISVFEPVLILPWIISCIANGHLNGGSKKFDIYVVAEENAKQDVLQELREKYDEVEEQSFFLPNKVLLVGRSKKQIAGFHIKSMSTNDEIMEDVRTFRQRPNVFLSNKVELLERHVRYFGTNDTQWSNMWQINGDVSPSMKIVEAWQSGYNGSGIIVSVVDDGLQTDHSDLNENVRLDGHYDFVDNDNDPYPPDNFRHGTQVAGLIAAERDNENCIVGVAYGSKLIGIRFMGSSHTTDITEANAIAHGHDVIDISCNSWGPPDRSGYFAPGALTAAAFEFGVTHGRGGKGVIYLWAAGNGGTTDNCNADGYANSIYTVTISSVNAKGQPAWYSEVCPPALAVTYSGDRFNRFMTTTSNLDLCSGGMEGTSLSAPQAAGMVALALQANPNLTWRDVQHLIVKTAKYQNLTEATEYGFTLNGAGNYVGQMFGYGLMDAEAMVRYAKNWTTVPKQEIYTSNISSPYWVLNSTLYVESETLEVERTCPINYLEHVKVLTTFQSSQRANVELELVSPAGTRSKLMTRRIFDHGVSSEQVWVFMSVQFWGEDPEGNWTFSIRIPSIDTGNLTSWQLILYGTSTDPLSGIPPCDESPCENGGNCTSNSKYDIYSCECAPGYTGKTCETDINECYNSPCEGNSTCENRPGKYECLCSSGFSYNDTGGNCYEINECESCPCLDNATCMDLVNAYNCTCPDGYVYNYTSDPNKCQEINECDSVPCPDGATCVDLVDAYNCTCPAGYVYNYTSDPKKCQDLDECKLNRCSDGEECVNTIGSYICNCTHDKGCNDAGSYDASGLSAELITVIVLSSLIVLTVSGVSGAWLVRRIAFNKKSDKIPPLHTDVGNSPPQHIFYTDGTLKENTDAHNGVPPMNHTIAKGQ